MSKLIFFSLIVLLVGCERIYEQPYYSSDLPSFSLSYGNNMGIQFNSAGITVQTQVDGDTTDPRCIVRVFDDTCTLTITMHRVEFTEGEYKIDGIKDSVSLVKYGKTEVGRFMPSSYFVFVVGRIDNGMMAGFYSGQLYNPFLGREVPIEGSFSNVRAR